jgi:hypothetical protein
MGMTRGYRMRTAYDGDEARKLDGDGGFVGVVVVAATVRRGSQIVKAQVASKTASMTMRVTMGLRS